MSGRDGMLLQVEKSTSTNPMKGGIRLDRYVQLSQQPHHQIFCLGYNVARGWFLLCQDEITSVHDLKPSEMLNPTFGIQY